MKILVRVTNWIGDVVMNLPALERLRQEFPDAEIVAMGRSSVLDVLSFRKDLVNRLMPIDDKQAFKQLSLLRQTLKNLRAEHFELAVIFTKHFKGAALPFLAGIPKRWGLKTPETRLFLNGGVSFQDLPSSGRHQSLNYLDIMNAQLGPQSAQPLPPRLIADEQLAATTRNTFLPDAKRPLLFVHAGAAYGTAKRWLPERYAQVCKSFSNETAGQVVLLGVASEAALNQAIREAAGVEVIDLSGKTSLLQSLALLSQCDLFLSNDSGLMHAAAAFSRPQVAIFGPTDFRATFPQHAMARLLHHSVPCSPCFLRDCKIGHLCMKGVQVETVVNSIINLLKESALTP